MKPLSSQTYQRRSTESNRPPVGLIAYGSESTLYAPFSCDEAWYATKRALDLQRDEVRKRISEVLAAESIGFQMQIRDIFLGQKRILGHLARQGTFVVILHTDSIGQHAVKIDGSDAFREWLRVMARSGIEYTVAFDVRRRGG